MIAKKSENILLIILKCFREAKVQEASMLLKRVLNNQEASLFKMDVEYTLKQLRLENESDACKKLNENIRPNHVGWVDLLCYLLQYIIEREKGSSAVIDMFENLFKCTRWLLDEQRCPIFSYLTKQVVSEQYKIIRNLKKMAKDSETVKRASKAQKDLESISLQIISNLTRELNQRNLYKLKLQNSNQQMKIYFKGFKFDRAAGCDKVDKEPDLLINSPKQDQLTYHYYKGRILIFHSKFAEASYHLSQVLQECPRTQKGLSCAKQVLKYLIPVNFFMGRYPEKEFLQFFPEYELISQSVKFGNIDGLQKAIDKYKPVWIRRSLLILLDQLKVLCYRNLCKKVWLIHKKTTKIHLEMFVRAFKLSHPLNSAPSSMEVCCIIANLIYLDLVAGKIYQDRSKNIEAVTLSKEPFNKRPQEINWQK